MNCSISDIFSTMRLASAACSAWCNGRRSPVGGSNPIRGFWPLFAMNGNIFVVSDTVLLALNCAVGSQATQLSCW
ncbi:hypothetical protein K432DRAFT_454359 [Lepidopterella palustris CBS 459.81]|uniref:Uncharacterized protein n=1 Tax=Lepidopterella palustris CBS 459.81 TaxID=1314670 RepID=A0A8E2DW15_9PEZI|nr:hypothetical protein K432DRAFT_454359 [Lepidopterella palustris CBS 459.81]